MAKIFLKTSPMVKRNIVWITIIIATFLLGYFFNTLLVYIMSTNTPDHSTVSIRQNDPEHKLIKPLLLCYEKSSDSELSPLHNLLQSYVSKAEKTGDATDVSVYFRNMNNGEWAGINENDRYSPASLFKVPVMIAYLKLAESNPDILNNQVLYESKVNLNSSEVYATKDTLTDGGKYSFDNLLSVMIEKSDNNALAVLENFLDQKILNEVTSDLGIPSTPDSDNAATSDYISVRSYSRFFRVLYNSTYLSHEYSEKALEYLSKTTFPGIRSGVPSDVTVASKFGERSVLDDVGNVKYRELHDCGVVYADENPYSICIMTKGADFAKLQNVIQDISKMVYQNTSKKP